MGFLLLKYQAETDGRWITKHFIGLHIVNVNCEKKLKGGGGHAPSVDFCKRTYVFNVLWQQLIK